MDRNEAEAVTAALVCALSHVDPSDAKRALKTLRRHSNCLAGSNADQFAQLLERITAGAKVPIHKLLMSLAKAHRESPKGKCSKVWLRVSNEFSDEAKELVRVQKTLPYQRRMPGYASNSDEEDD